MAIERPSPLGDPKSLDASGGSASRNLLDAAESALIRAAASTQPLADNRDASQTDRKNARLVEAGP